MSGDLWNVSFNSAEKPDPLRSVGQIFLAIDDPMKPMPGICYWVCDECGAKWGQFTMIKETGVMCARCREAFAKKTPYEARLLPERLDLKAISEAAKHAGPALAAPTCRDSEGSIQEYRP